MELSVRKDLPVQQHYFFIWLVLFLCSDWLILGYYSPVTPTSLLQDCKTKGKSHIILTLNAQSLRRNLKPLLCHID